MDLPSTIAGWARGNQWPYGGGQPGCGSVEAIADYLRKVIAGLGDSTHLEVVEFDFNSYWSGYASYVDIFCGLRGDPELTKYRAAHGTVVGLALYLSRLAPVAVFAAQERRRSARGGSSGFVAAEEVYAIPDGSEWSVAISELVQHLEKGGFTVPSREQLHLPVPPELDIPTILSDPPWKVFDALFFWED